MRHATTLLLAAAALSVGGGMSAAPMRAPRRRLDGHSRPKPTPWARDVACPRCGAGVGEPCDRRTLGRHMHHKARVDAFKDTERD